MTNTIQTKSGKIVRIRIRNVGQAFGCEGQLVARNGRVIASTRTYPYGFTAAAWDGAVALAKTV